MVLYLTNQLYLNLLKCGENVTSTDEEIINVKYITWFKCAVLLEQCLLKDGIMMTKKVCYLKKIPKKVFRLSAFSLSVWLCSFRETEGWKFQQDAQTLHNAVIQQTTWIWFRIHICTDCDKIQPLRRPVYERYTN